MDKEVENQSVSLIAKPTALVAGGAGFVGSFLCQSLLFQGCRVVAIDNLSSGQKNNLSFCFGNPDFSLIEHDLTRPFSLNISPDYIFMVAGMENYLSAKLKSLLVNSDGVLNLLQLAQKSTAKFLLASTSSMPAVGYRGVKKVLDQQASLSRLQSARSFAEELVFNFKDQGVDAKIGRLGPLYGPRMNLSSSSEINVLLASFFRKNNQFRLAAEHQIRPLFISDAVFGLMKLMFSTCDDREVIYTLVGEEELSLYDLGQRLGKLIGRDCQADFYQQKFWPNQKIANSLTGWRATIGLDEGLKKTIEYLKAGEQQKSVRKEPAATNSRPLLPMGEPRSVLVEPLSIVKEVALPKTKKVSPLAVRKIGFKGTRLFLPLLIFVLLVILPILPLSFKTMMAGWHGWRSMQFLEQNRAQDWLSSADKTYRWATMVGDEVEKLDEIAPIWEIARFDLTREVWYLKKVSLINWQLARLANEVESWGEVVFSTEDRPSPPETGLAVNILEQVWWELTYLENDQKENHSSPLFLNWLSRKTGESFNAARLGLWRQSLYQFKELVPWLPQLIGYDKKMTYLVILQNNMELRPTGGFIGSFALISFDQGRLVQNEVFDVYDADGQLKGHVDPPEPIKTYLGEAGWYLRDSNWDPNFPNSGLKAGWFLEKTMGLKIDGVVGLNLFFAEQLLERMGPVTLTDYGGKEVNSANLYELAQKYAEANFFPGSTEKKDFLGAVARGLLLKIKEGGVGDLQSLGQAVLSSAEQKEIAFWMADDRLEGLMGRFNWDGSLRQPECLGSRVCFKDYLMIVEANLGVNKVNYYLDRDINLGVDLTETGRIKRELEIRYENKSQPGDFYGGDYKNYLRLYLPLGTKIDQVEIGKDVLSADELDETIESGKSVIGFLVIVPAGESQTVKVDYHQLGLASEGYTFYLQRQPGSNRSLLEVDVRVSAVSKPTTALAGGLTEDGIGYAGVFDRDLVLGY